MTLFYSHLVEINSVIENLDQMDLNDEEKLELAKLIDSSLHHRVLDVILSELSDSDKRVFMQHLNKGEHDRIWQFLNEKVDGVEIKIKKVVEDLKTELHEDMKESEKLKVKG